jgi:hypothetical protein
MFLSNLKNQILDPLLCFFVVTTRVLETMD